MIGVTMEKGDASKEVQEKAVIETNSDKKQNGKPEVKSEMDDELNDLLDSWFICYSINTDK